MFGFPADAEAEATMSVAHETDKAPMRGMKLGNTTTIAPPTPRWFSWPQRDVNGANDTRDFNLRLCTAQDRAQVAFAIMADSSPLDCPGALSAEASVLGYQVFVGESVNSTWATMSWAQRRNQVYRHLMDVEARQGYQFLYHIYMDSTVAL